MGRIASFVTAGLLASATGALPTHERTIKRATNDTGVVNSFEDVPHSADLHWTPCFEKYHCANLEVPLDYAEPNIGTTIVAFIRQEAANGTGQDILFNPGGPGISGIGFILDGEGDKIMKTTGGKYNIVSFDPRGVNNSATALPLTCFPEDPETRDIYYKSTFSYDSPNELYYQAVALGQWCSEANNETLARYAGTPAVAQDILRFTELQAAQDGAKPEEAQIWYFGVSYGTVIGQTLAAMFPDRIGRILLDGNVNAEDWYTGITKTELEDADDVLEWFFRLCYEAGPQKCAFAGDSGSPGDIKKRFNDLLHRLEREPIVQSDPNSPLSIEPEIFTKSRVLNGARGMLYSPYDTFSSLALGLAGLESNNVTTYLMAQMAQMGSASPPIDGPFNYSTTAFIEASQLIANVDAAGRYPINSVYDYLKVAEEIQNISLYSGKDYAESKLLQCAGFKITPPESQSFSGFQTTKTKNPIFFINNSADPATPLSSAKHMSQFFECSVVLEQNSAGHMATSFTSSCLLGHISNYLENGDLPKADTVCEMDTKPLVDSPALQERSLPTVPVHLH